MRPSRLPLLIEEESTLPRGEGVLAHPAISRGRKLPQRLLQVLPQVLDVFKTD